MENEICPIMEQCNMFDYSFLMKEIVGKTYKKEFCLKPSRFKECKRYIVYLETGKQVPEYIMPNSQLSIDEISCKIEY